jgi:NAD(P)H-dependent FMN reductase
MAQFKVGIIIGSQRAVRICPQVAQFVLEVIELHHMTAVQAAPEQVPEVAFELLDIGHFNLPLTDEPGMPAHIKERPAGYATGPTRVWSAAVEACDAFVFVTPQYNWGIPAALKNAIDHLFQEWAGKPAFVVAYGGHGGTVAAAALITVLSGIFMRVAKKAVYMSYPNPTYLQSAVEGKGMGLDAKKNDGTWAMHRAEIIELWEELLIKLGDGKGQPEFRSAGLMELWERTISPVAGIEAKKNAEKRAASREA